MPSKTFLDMCEKAKKIHIKKNRDYAQEGNWHSNFDRSAQIASWLNDPVDRAFATLIGVKLARIAELRNGKTPNNESLEDSFLDLFVYAGMWGAYVSEQMVHRDIPEPACP